MNAEFGLPWNERALVAAFLLISVIVDGARLFLLFGPKPGAAWLEALARVGVLPSGLLLGVAFFAVFYLAKKKGKFLLVAVATLAAYVAFVSFLALASLLEPSQAQSALWRLISIVIPAVCLLLLWWAIPPQVKPKA